MTKAGHKTALDLYDADSITFSYFPYDKTTVIRRTLDQINPKIIVIAETDGPVNGKPI